MDAQLFLIYCFCFDSHVNVQIVLYILVVWYNCPIIKRCSNKINVNLDHKFNAFQKKKKIINSTIANNFKFTILYVKDGIEINCLKTQTTKINNFVKKKKTKINNNISQSRSLLNIIFYSYFFFFEN